MGVIEISDIITLDNNKKYIVTGMAEYEKVNYLHLLNEDDYSMAFAAIEGNKVILLNNKEDKILINELMPLFLQSVSKALLEQYQEK